jgi:hypothetical protein
MQLGIHRGSEVNTERRFPEDTSHRGRWSPCCENTSVVSCCCRSAALTRTLSLQMGKMFWRTPWQLRLGGGCFF